MDRPSLPSHSSVITPPLHDCDNIHRLAKLITQAMLWTFSILYYDAKSKTMVDWDWPADDENNMILPDQFENYRKERNLKYPCCVCTDGTQQTYVEAIVYPWWNETTRTWVWITRCATDRCTYEATITKHSRISTQRLSSFTSGGISTEEFRTLFKSCVDGLRWWIDCQSNPTLQFELRLLLFLLEEHVYSGDLWRLVMARQIEVMQEERLYKIQPQNCTGTDRFAKELELLEDKKDRAQLELSLYSQAMDVFRPHLRCNTTDESASITSRLLILYKMLVLPEIACHPYRLVSTWVEECMEEYYMDDRATEGASLQILILQAGELSDSEADMCLIDAELSLMQSRYRCAQTEVELLSDAIQYLIESNTKKQQLFESYVNQQKLELIVVRHLTMMSSMLT
ncbi:uncharacterized protein F5147DRAFT_657755 [Suillus discolor]|uniref:Uncharacterized protein n=1 Tax=Suillus discolor TaxID=1912936 RepID=A0A9P7EWB0_9AGAM|nr:uncharacterized protein F5147DRAFT_657755 [Suillus discolor]KAG2092137.1 hypothetical protein F5147DRAFT_657755 [Suillus discolor]